MKARSITPVIAALLTAPRLLVCQSPPVSNTSTLGFFDQIAPFGLRNLLPSMKAPDLSTGGVQALVIALAGKWRFDVFSLNQAAPIASGQREMQLLDDSTKLAWTETFVGQSRVGTGMLGYNWATGAWYLVGAYTHDPDPVVLIGRADSSDHVLVFDPVEVTSRPGTYVSSKLRIVDASHLEWVASDGRWRVLFNRIGRP